MAANTLEPERILVPVFLTEAGKWIRLKRIWIRLLPDLDPAKPDPNPDLAGSRSGSNRSWIRFSRI